MRRDFFFHCRPLHLDKMVSEIKGIDSIAWNNHVINTNDFKYSKIAEQLQSMQRFVVALIAVAAVLGFLVFIADTDIQDSWKNAGSRHFTCRRKTETADYRAISDRGNDSAVDRLSS